MLRVFKSRTMMSQIALFNLFIFILLIAFIVGTYQIVSNLIVGELSKVQQQIFLKTRVQEMNSLLYYQERLISRFLTLNTNELVIAHRLVLHLYDQPMDESDFEFDFQGQKPIPKILDNNAEGFSVSYSLFCGQTIKEPQIKKKEHTLANMIGHTVLLHQQVSQGQSMLHGVLNFDPKIIFSFQCYHRGKTIFDSYDVDTRPWYIEAQKLYLRRRMNKNINFSLLNLNSVLYSYILVYMTNIIGMAIYVPQVNSFNELIGVWSRTFYPSMFDNQLKQTENADMILLVDKSGILIVHNITTDVPLIYFQNQTITGFNDDDWHSVKDGRVDQNTCIGNLKIPNQICKFNTVYQKDFHIIKTMVTGFDLYLIIWYDIGPFQIQFDQENELIQDTISQSRNELLSQSILAQVGITITFTFGFLILVTGPLNSIVFHIKAALSSQGTKHKINFHKVSILHSSHVQGLLKSFNCFMKKIVNSQLTKTPYCRLMEKFMYRRREKVGYRNKWKRATETLEDNRLDVYQNS